jgi:aryl-alcohol dehydrogenase-like predicted oxidoreductase
LTVSAVGPGVQNMNRNYETTGPDRPETIHVIPAAFHRGVTFYAAAEACEPRDVERILGEGVAPFRDQVQIATRFGCNIDQETGERSPGRNSGRLALRSWSRACRGVFASIGSTSLTASVRRCCAAASGISCCRLRSLRH